MNQIVKPAKKAKPREVFRAEIVIHRPCCFSESGMAQSSRAEDISGEFEVVSPQHIYNWRLGIDVYPTKEQMVLLREGKKLEFHSGRFA